MGYKYSFSFRKDPYAIEKLITYALRLNRRRVPVNPGRASEMYTVIDEIVALIGLVLTSRTFAGSLTEAQTRRLTTARAKLQIKALPWEIVPFTFIQE